jgi:quaternary ammonium compound-resistance protein SugE
MAWLWLVLAGAFEIAWTIGLKYTDGFTRGFWPSLGTAVAMVASMVLLAIAVRELPIGTAYAVWVGIGALGTAVLGIALFGEDRSLPRLSCLLLLVVGIVGLKLTTPASAAPPGAAPAEAPR